MKILRSFFHSVKNLYNFETCATHTEARHWMVSSSIVLCLFIAGHVTFVSFLSDDVLDTLPIDYDMLIALPLIAALLLHFIVSIALAARRVNAITDEDFNDEYDATHPKGFLHSDRAELCVRYGPIASSMASLALIAIVAFTAYSFYQVADQADTEHTVKTFEKVDLGLSVLWADKNIGADKQQAPGDKFAWGETKTKEEFTYYECETTEDSLPKLLKEGYVDKDGVLTAAHDAAAANSSGEGWRTPTKEEFQELLAKCKWQAEHIGEVKGYRVTGPNGNSIFLPVCATHKYIHDGDWNYGHYWTSTAYNDDYSAAALYFDFKDDSISNRVHRDYGLCIRPVCDKEQ